MPAASSRLKNLPVYLFSTMDEKVAKAKAEGKDVIGLGVGDPDLPTPAIIVEAMQRATADAKNHDYPPYKGTGEFCDSVQRWMKNRFGVDVDTQTEVHSLIGSKEGLAHLILGYIEPNDVVLCPSPGYPVYHNYTIICGGQPYTVPLLADNGFLPDLDAIPADIAARAKLLFLNYPNNPTGGIATEDFIKKAIAFCKKYDILLCHDNAYSEMTFDGYKAPSFLSVEGAKDVCIEMFSLSKMYNMTGWRVGFAVGNAEAIKVLGTIKSNTDSGVFKAIQHAAAVGLDHSASLTEGLNDIYGRRRKIMVDGLKELGWPMNPEPATFYLWVPVPTGMKSVEFTEMLLERCAVVVPSGTGYGAVGEGFFRIALTVSEERLKDVLKRMKDQGMTWDQLARKNAA